MRRSLMEHSFSRTPTINIPRSTFDRSHMKITAFDADYIVPVLVDEVVPGDTFNCEMAFMCRMSTPMWPIMENLYLESFFFFTPYRILWDNWEHFLGAQDDPDDSIAYTIPQITLDTNLSGGHSSIGDYMEIPLINYGTSNYSCSAFPFQAYALIWNEWFRDENLQDRFYATHLTGGDGPFADNIVYNGCLKRGKRHDYFTSCLPFLQKGDAVELPLGDQAIVKGLMIKDTNAFTNTDNQVKVEDGTAYTTDDVSTLSLGIHTGYGGVYADLSTATAATVNEVRQAFQVQRFLEQCARGGTRYVEIIKNIYGIDNAGGDARLQRPEYLGGGSSVINVNPVACTGSGGDFVPGQMSAAGTCYGKHGFIKSFTEHGVILGLVSVRSDIMYQSEGFDRFWQRSTRYDFYAPAFAHLGEMAVLNRELYLDDATITAGTDVDVFGYQMQWDDMRYKVSKVTGILRSSQTASLDAWHLAEEFGAEQALDDTFIVANSREGIDRSQQIATEPHFFLSAYFNYRCTRPMPVYSVPGLIDHL